MFRRSLKVKSRPSLKAIAGAASDAAPAARKTRRESASGGAEPFPDMFPPVDAPG